MKSTTRKAKVSRPTLSVDYTPEAARARELVDKAATAFIGFQKRGDGTILPQCVEATRAALTTGMLVKGNEGGEVADGAWNGKTSADKFHTAGSEITFWKRLARYLDAGGSVGDDLWNTLALKRSGMPSYMAKRTEVGKVIDDGGSLADIAAEVDRLVKAPKKSRTARPASEKDGESAQSGLPTSADPVADALLCVLGLSEACKRIPVEDVDGFAKVRKAMAEVARRESTLRKPKGTTVAALAPTG